MREHNCECTTCGKPLYRRRVDFNKHYCNRECWSDEKYRWIGYIWANRKTMRPYEMAEYIGIPDATFRTWLYRINQDLPEELKIHFNKGKKYSDVSWNKERLDYIIKNAATLTAEEFAAHFKCNVGALQSQISKWRKKKVDVPLFRRKEHVITNPAPKQEKKTVNKIAYRFTTPAPKQEKKTIIPAAFDPAIHQMIKLDNKTWKQVYRNL